MGWRYRIATKQHGGIELTEPQFLTLDTLVQMPAAMTVGKIQRAIGVLPAQMSRIIKSLENCFEQPLIKCELNQSDRRKIDVQITPAGKQAYDEFRHVRLSRSVEILKELPDGDRQEFVRICRRIRELLKIS
jgi:DNA-binding MarR family transcriptional regulator